MTEVELHVGTFSSTKSSGTTLVGLASFVTASRFASKHAVFKLKGVFLWSFPAQR